LHLLFVKNIIDNFKCQNQIKNLHQPFTTKKEKNNFEHRQKMSLQWNEHKSHMISRKELP